MYAKDVLHEVGDGKLSAGLKVSDIWGEDLSAFPSEYQSIPDREGNDILNNNDVGLYCIYDNHALLA